MSNTDRDSVPKEKKMRKATANTSSTQESNRDTTPTQESFSHTGPLAATHLMLNLESPILTPLPPSSKDSNESAPIQMDTQLSNSQLPLTGTGQTKSSTAKHLPPWAKSLRRCSSYGAKFMSPTLLTNPPSDRPQLKAL